MDAADEAGKVNDAEMGTKTEMGSTEGEGAGTRHGWGIWGVLKQLWSQGSVALIPSQ